MICKLSTCLKKKKASKNVKDVIKIQPNVLNQIQNAKIHTKKKKGKEKIVKRKYYVYICLSVCKITGNASSFANSWE